MIDTTRIRSIFKPFSWFKYFYSLIDSEDEPNYTVTAKTILRSVKKTVEFITTLNVFSTLDKGKESLENLQPQWETLGSETFFIRARTRLDPLLKRAPTGAVNTWSFYTSIKTETLRSEPARFVFSSRDWYEKNRDLILNPVVVFIFRYNHSIKVWSFVRCFYCSLSRRERLDQNQMFLT